MWWNLVPGTGILFYGLLASLVPKHDQCGCAALAGLAAALGLDGVCPDRLFGVSLAPLVAQQLLELPLSVQRASGEVSGSV